jgi:hypothetical protein
VFLVGAFAVLYSTFFVATAANTRMAADCLRVCGVLRRGPAQQRAWARAFCVIFPLLSVTIFAISKSPVLLVLISGLTQSIMLPMLGGAARYFRFRRCDPRSAPGMLWNVLLCISVVGLLITGVWGALGGFDKLASWYQAWQSAA